MEAETVIYVWTYKNNSYVSTEQPKRLENFWLIKCPFKITIKKTKLSKKIENREQVQELLKELLE